MGPFLGADSGGPARLRELLAGTEPVLAPGVFDGLGARLVEEAGFPAVYMTGFGTAAALLGRPDVGLLTMSVMVEIAAVASRLGDVPLLFNWAEGGKTPPIDHARLAELGFRIVIFPIATLLGTTGWMRRALAEIRKAGTPLPIMGELPRFGEFLDF